MTLLPLPQWLCFDLDGTLVDSAPDLTISLNYMLVEMQLAPTHEESVRAWIGNGAIKLITRALSNAGLAEPNDGQLEQAKKLFFAAYADNIANGTYCYPHCNLVLSNLCEAGVRLACVTNKPRQFTVPLLEKLAIKEYFGALVCGDDLPSKKPDPEPLWNAIEQLEGSLERGYMVGDSKTDMISAQQAGVGAIFVTYGYNRGDSMDRYDLIQVDSLRQLLQLFSTERKLDVSTS